MAQVNLVDALISRMASVLRVPPPAVGPDEGASVDHSPLAELLARAGDGWSVDYEQVRASAELARYLERLADADPSILGRDEQLAFWINAYNANAMALASRRDVSSILDIPRAFTAVRVRVGGERLTLDEIEHAKVRWFGDFRVHFALNCASVGCPPLRVYSGANLGAELDDNGRRYLFDDLRGARGEGDRVLLAMVFRWFAGDFAPVGSMPSAWGSILSTARPQRVLPAARPYLPVELADTTRVGFIPWDWSLNARR
jgi:hypothetical protein